MYDRFILPTVLFGALLSGSEGVHAQNVQAGTLVCNLSGSVGMIVRPGRRSLAASATRGATLSSTTA